MGLTIAEGLYIIRASVEFHSALAQLVEQMTVNHWVAGSSPAGGAKHEKGLAKASPFFMFQYNVLAGREGRFLLQQKRHTRHPWR